MMFTELKINNNTYKCRLSAKSTILCERALGKNVLNVLADAQNSSLPKLEELITIFHFAISSNNVDETYQVYDEYIEEGHTIMDFLELIIKIFEDSGLIPKDEVKEESEEKN